MEIIMFYVRLYISIKGFIINIFLFNNKNAIMFKLGEYKD